ncbi:MAG: tryptophan--tRNA ligase [Rickettsiaceae bacterium]|nr:tryptophan--tRNA ligase [Rickettsiaceae bacterium]
MKKVISALQTSGNIHLGNYLGAIKNWIKLQDQYDCIFFLADLHAITVPQDPVELSRNIYNSLAAIIASGIDYNRSIVFAQSDVKQHAELSWILTCNTPIGFLKRMTQFKDKSSNPEGSSCGLFCYPVLMSADILLYDADLVPVGEDQKQHLELTRDIAGFMNRKIGKPIFKEPEPLIAENVARIKSLKDGSKKMSKSDPSDLSRVNLHDSKDEIISKIKKAKTDSLDFISYDQTRLEVSNLLEIFGAVTQKDPGKIAIEYEAAGFARFKSDLAEILADHMAPLTQKYNDLKQDKGLLNDILINGARKATQLAKDKLSLVKKEMGFLDLV